MHHLTVELSNLEGALLRLLGTTERRGWRAVRVHAQPHHEHLAVDLTVSGSGSVDLLLRQLGRLVEVTRVTLTPALKVSA